MNLPKKSKTTKSSSITFNGNTSDESIHELKKGTDKWVRVQLDLPLSQVMELDSLVDLTGARTRKEFINNALSMFIWAIKEINKGRIIASVDEANDSYREVVMPILRNAANEK